jgi:hypothetical protein
MHSECKGIAPTCANRKCWKSARVFDARLWTQKVVHTSKRRINDFGHSPTHFWFTSQVDLTPKSELNLSGGLVKYLKGPLFTLKTSWIIPQRFEIKRGHGCTKFLRIYLYCYATSILLQGTSFVIGAYKHQFIGPLISPLV